MAAEVASPGFASSGEDGARSRRRGVPGAALQDGIVRVELVMRSGSRHDCEVMVQPVDGKVELLLSNGARIVLTTYETDLLRQQLAVSSDEAMYQRESRHRPKHYAKQERTEDDQDGSTEYESHAQRWTA